ARLDAAGRAASAAGASPSWSVRLDGRSGRFTVRVAAADLRQAVGLDAAAGRGRVLRDVVVGLGAADARACVPFAFTPASARARTFALVARGLPASSFAADGVEAPLSVALTVRTTDGDASFTTDATLRRANVRARQWRR